MLHSGGQAQATPHLPAAEGKGFSGSLMPQILLWKYQRHSPCLVPSPPTCTMSGYLHSHVGSRDHTWGGVT